MIILAVFFVLTDRFFKVLCLKGFFDLPVKLAGDIFTLHYVKNYYIAFSLPFSGPILTIIIGIIILILIVYWLKSLISAPRSLHPAPNIFPLTLLIIGAILNFTDRIRYGFVIDYLDLKYFTVFNLADILLVTSIIWIIIFNKQKKYAI